VAHRARLGNLESGRGDRVTELTLGITGALGSAGTWALICVLAQTLSGRFTSAGINAFRALVGGGLVLIGALAAGYGPQIVGMPLWVAGSLWVSILIGYAGGDTVFFLGMQELGVTRAHTLSMAHPLMSTAAGIVLFGEPVTVGRAAGILLVVGGITLIVTGQGETGADTARAHRRGVLLVLAAAVAWTVGSVMLKPPLEVVAPITATAVRSPMVGLALWCTPWARGTWRAVRTLPGRGAVVLGAICALSALSPVLYVTGIKYGGVAVGTVLSTTSPLFTIPLEVLLLGRWPSRRTILGAIVTVGGITLMG
jgi:drug/metabolite transporter (DMT)-like permease